MRIHWMLTTAGLAMAAAASGEAQDPKGGAGSEPQIRTIWSGTDLDLEGRVSRDGRYVLFEDGVTGDLAVRDLQAGKTRPIIRNNNPRESAGTAEFSEDGSQIVYSWQKADGSLELWIARADGSYPRLIYTSTEEVFYIDPDRWSADGRHVLARLQTRDQTHRIAWIPVDGGPPRVLKTLNWGYPHVHLSPDGKWIAYDFPPKEDSNQEDIFLLAADGSREIHLVEHPQDDDLIAWLPDSRGLLIRSNRRGPDDDAFLVRIGDDGKALSAPQLVKADIGDVTGRGISRDGVLFYEAESEDVQQVYVAELDLTTGALAKRPMPATERFRGHTISSAWSRDGKHLAFYVSGRANQPAGPRSRTLIVRNVDTGVEQDFVIPVHGFRGRSLGLRWSPDGKSILMRANDFEDNRGHIYRLQLESGKVAALVRTEPGVFLGIGATWSPEGEKLYYNTFEEGSPVVSRILERDLGTGAEREVFRSEAPNLIGPRVELSPDGKQVAFLTPSTYGASTLTTLQVISTKGGEPREVYRVAADKRVRLSNQILAWTPDGQSLLFGVETPTDPIERPVTRVWRIPVDGGEAVALELEIERPRDLRLHPDGRRVAFTARKEVEELRTMTGILPKVKASRK